MVEAPNWFFWIIVGIHLAGAFSIWMFFYWPMLYKRRQLSLASLLVLTLLVDAALALVTVIHGR
jgi:hypothetical protein